jgi:hypothetical protein
MWPYVKYSLFRNAVYVQIASHNDKKIPTQLHNPCRKGLDGELRHFSGGVLADTYYIQKLLSFY